MSADPTLPRASNTSRNTSSPWLSGALKGGEGEEEERKRRGSGEGRKILVNERVEERAGI